MNAGIVVLRDGTLCIAYDEKLPHPIRHVEFSRDDFQITLVYDVADERLGKQGKTFEFPLDHPFVKSLEDKQNIAIACMSKGQLLEIKMYSVVFTGG